jgi:hypothetical protein
VPAWTDQNENDPGFPLLSLLAWLAVALVFGLGLYAYLERRRDSSRWPP